jgi:hypothetical protein
VSRGGHIATEKDTSPSFAQLLQNAIDAKIVDLNIALPGIVVSYDRAKQRAKIQPALKRTYADGSVVDLPIINNVPVIFPKSGARRFHFDLEVGSPVQLLFSQRSLDIWKAKGGTVSPNDPRKFNLSDAVAIPGLCSIADAVAPVGPADSVEVSNGTNSIYIEKDGKVTIKNGGGKIEMSPAGKFKITNNTEELLSLLTQVVNLLSTTTTNTIFGPMKLNDFAQFAILKTKIESLKG